MNKPREFPTVVDLVRWNDSDPLAIIDQMRARVKAKIDAGGQVGWIGVLVEVDPEDGNLIYQPSYSTLSAEIVCMAAQRLIARVNDKQVIPV